MEQKGGWAVDHVAASQLLAELGLEETPERLDIATRHFARHREAMSQWAAKRIQDEIIGQLETASIEAFARASEDWASGFRFAESYVCGFDLPQFADGDMARPRSKGQLLRAMVRQARKS